MRIAEQWIRIYYYYEQKTGLNPVIDLVRWCELFRPSFVPSDTIIYQKQ